MTEFADNEAAKPNPALQALAALVGEWKTIGTHPLVPDITFHGRTSFGWLAGGAFLIMHSQIDEPQIPSGIAAASVSTVAFGAVRWLGVRDHRQRILISVRCVCSCTSGR